MDNTRDFTEAETIARVAKNSEPEIGLLDVNEGDMVAGYRVESLIGKGGMGKVFRVKDEMTGKVAALKVLILDESMSERDRRLQIERFTNEAQIMWQLSDQKIPCVPLIYHMPKQPLGIIMEYLSGTPLDVLLNQYVPDEQKDMRMRAMVEMLSTVAFALHKAHGLGIIHRDLKPSNILIRDYKDFTRPLQPVLVDFGIAKNPDRHLTESQTMMGTPAYMAPEQLMGKTDEVTPASDVFSMGLVLFRVLSGEELYTGLVSDGLPIFERVMGMLNVIKNSDSDGSDRIGKRLMAVQPAFRQVIRRCLAYDPYGRYRTMEELATALRPVNGVFTEVNQLLTVDLIETRLPPPPPPPEQTKAYIPSLAESTRDIRGNRSDFAGHTPVVIDKPESKKYKKLMVWGAFVAVFIISAVVLALAISGSKKTDKQNKDEQPSADKKDIKVTEKTTPAAGMTDCNKTANPGDFISCTIKQIEMVSAGEKRFELVNNAVTSICFSREKNGGQEENCLKLYDLVFKEVLKKCVKTPSGDPALDCIDKIVTSSIKSTLLQYLIMLEGHHRFCHGAGDKKTRASSKACMDFENKFAIIGPKGMKPLIEELKPLCSKENSSPTHQMECLRKQLSMSYKNPEIVHAGLLHLRVSYCFVSPKYKRAAESACKWMLRHIEKARKEADPYRGSRASLR